jgi:hypothetical protein
LVEKRIPGLEVALAGDSRKAAQIFGFEATKKDGPVKFVGNIDRRHGCLPYAPQNTRQSPEKRYHFRARMASVAGPGG